MRDALLIQQADGEHVHLLNLTIRDHADYCARHGFDYWPVYGSALTGKDSDRHAFWNKVALLRKAAADGYQYIVWLDSDCWIEDPETDLRDACRPDRIGMVWHGKKYWPEGPECYDHYNCGAIYIGNGREVQRLLKLWWNSPDDNHPWHDQHAYNKHALDEYERLCKRPSPSFCLRYEWNAVPFEPFTCSYAVVAAWHGYHRDLSLRHEAMEEYIRAAKLRRMVEACDVAEACQKAQYCASVGNLDGAVQFYARAAELGATGVDFLRDYANCQIQRRQWAAAVPLLQEALGIEESGLLWRMLSGCYDFLGDHDRNGAAIARSLALAPNAPAAMLNKAFHDLRAGKWSDGFDGLQWDFVQGGRKMRHPSAEWNRECDMRLFVWAEQGLGDTLMLFRFLRPLMGGFHMKSVVAEVQPALVSLLAGQISGVEVVAQTEDRSVPWEFDAHIGMFSLPRHMVLDPSDLSWPKFQSPYIVAPPDRVAQWAAKVNGPGLRVGFSWAGSEGHGNNVNRNATAGLFDAIIETPGTSWYCLQRGIEIPQEVRDDTPQVAFIGDEPQDMADVAGILANLDLVITIDSAIAHLAGAMGVPCMVLLSKSSDWRWLTEREDTVWYDSVRLFRQKTLGDWPEVMARVEVALKERMSNGE